MGTRHPDNIPLSVAAHSHRTVRAMREGHWDVIAKCRGCGLQLRVQLALIERVQGPGFSLWNRSAPCRRVGCLGRVDFIARPPQCSQHRALVCDDRERLP